MKKLQLDIDALRVDSFEAGTAEPTTRGTKKAAKKPKLKIRPRPS